MKFWLGVEHYLRATTAFGVLAFACADPSIAQSTPQAGAAGSAESSAQPASTRPYDTADPDSALEKEIVVTASRTGRDGYAAPTPTTIVSADAIASRGATNIGAVLTELPAFKASTTPSTNSVRSVSPGAYYADLRGLGQTRTLVLVDGNRFVPQITTGLGGYQVDLNQIPSLMIERTEVVTGGASAQWGSDAVAGVVNIILRKDFSGLLAESQYGVSEIGDNRELRLGLLVGFKVGDRGHIVAGVDYVDNKGVGDVFTRDWGRLGYGVLANPCALAAPVSTTCPTGGNGLARTLILPDVRLATATKGGLINSTTGPAAALRGIMFGPNGTLSQFGYGNYVGSAYMQGGSSNALVNNNEGVSIAPANSRLIGYLRGSYDISDSIQFHAEGSYARSKGANQTLPARNEQTSPIVVRLDNPFIPAALRTIIQNYNATHPAAPITTFNVGRFSTDLGRQQGDVVNTTYRGVAGLDGSLGSDWKWDANYIYGQNDYQQRVANDRILSRFNFAADVTTDASGVPVCRGVLNGVAAAAGCVPLNIFGEGSPSQDAINYATGTLRTSTLYTQNAANLNLRGEPFSTWAGRVSVAVGGEWRHERQVTKVDPIAEIAGYESTNARSFTGSFSVKEAYLETVVPIARDWVLAQSLDLNAAVRIADYSTSAGTQTTWKAGLTWKPVSGVLIRAGRSRDIRAPNLFELFTPPVSTINTQIFTASVNGGPVGNIQTQTLTGGNARLTPEKADTLTAGIVLTPRQVPGLSLSVDYYDIKIKQAISTLPDVINGCVLRRDPLFCSNISVLPAGSAAVYLITANYVNLARVQRTGVDFDLTYRRSLDSISDSLPGVITLRIAAAYVQHYRADANGTGYIERAGEISANGSPHWTTTSSISYTLPRATIMLQMRTIEHGKYDNTFTEGVDINDNSIPGRSYFNLSGSFKLTSNIELFGVVNNLFDKAPPLYPANFNYPTIATYFDMIGRTYRFGARAKY